MRFFSSLNAILIESPEGGQFGQKRAKIHQLYKHCLFSQKVFDEFYSNCTKWRPIMTSFSILNEILIESPKGGQIGQKQAKIHQFYKLCLFSLNLFDEFLSNCTNWRFIIIPFSVWNTILIESPEGGQIGQNWAKVHWFCKLCLFSQKLFDELFSHCTKWRLIISPTCTSIRKAILVESPGGGQIGQKWAKIHQFYKL